MFVARISIHDLLESFLSGTLNFIGSGGEGVCVGEGVREEVKECLEEEAREEV